LLQDNAKKDKEQAEVKAVGQFENLSERKTLLTK